MTSADPRWTVEEWPAGYASIVGTFPGVGQVYAAVCSRRSARPIKAPEAKALLVAAVRDADLLRQARQLAESVSQHRDTILGTYGAAQTFFTLGDLLDLLAPASGTGTGTGTPTPEDRDPCPICGYYGHPSAWHDGTPTPGDTQTQEKET